MIFFSSNNIYIFFFVYWNKKIRWETQRCTSCWPCWLAFWRWWLVVGCRTIAGRLSPKAAGYRSHSPAPTFARPGDNNYLSGPFITLFSSTISTIIIIIIATVTIIRAIAINSHCLTLTTMTRYWDSNCCSPPPFYFSQDNRFFFWFSHIFSCI